MTLWKGLGSSLLVRGIALGIEDLISKITPWPKYVNFDQTEKSYLNWVKLQEQFFFHDNHCGSINHFII